MNEPADGVEFQWSLLQGERVLWAGRPGTGIMFSSRDALLIPFSLMWGGFAIFWETKALTMHTPMFFRVWGIPFILVGLFFISGRFILDAWLRGQMHYAVTSQRILINRAGIGGKFTSLSLDRLPEVQLKPVSGGRSTIVFGAAPSLGMINPGRGGFGAWLPALDPIAQFIAIPDGQGVFDRIQRAIRGDT